MAAAKIVITDEELSDEILQLNSANFSLRVALIFLIVTVLIFSIMQLIKLIGQIWGISKKAAESDIFFDSEIPEVILHPKDRNFRKKSKRRGPKYSLPSKKMKLQLSLTNEREGESSSNTSDENRDAAELKVIPPDKTQKLSDELSIPDIQDSLASFGNKSLIPVSNLKNQSSSTPISTKQESTLPTIKAQDSLMAIDNQKPLSSVDNVEKESSKAEAKEHEHIFQPAKLQDSLMVVNSQIPLQPVGSNEEPNLKIASKPEK
ncbi:unnamed protein product [Onchocerca flexuosa]|uniref:Membrane associated protein n=1 Tax=Onchocerca flexuosa TaxID=387005 RepID=A0A183H9C0_9BILA|nr:unnamed protein product [Onchocerca flexuosa]